MTGISLYSTKTLGIGGQVKRRYSDFIVEEIEIDDYVCEVKWFNRNDFSAETEQLAVPKTPDERTHTHLHFELEKINMDLNFAIRIISRKLQTSKTRIGYAGLKDKRGITCQKISIFRPKTELLENFHAKGIVLRNPEWKTGRIEIGNLKGNRFNAIIRGISLEENELKKRIESCFSEMNENGVANYFGEQRFGGIREVTHLVGKEFVKENIESGVMLYLTHTNGREPEDIRAARENLAKTLDFVQASKDFPQEYTYERAIIHHLCKNPKDFVGAFAKLAKPLRYLFTHAYQSFLFNKIINKRIESGMGLKPTDDDVLENGLPTAPLFGYESKFSNGKIGEIEKSILEEEGITFEQFKINQMGELSVKGQRKEIVLFPQELKLLEIGKDEFFEGKLFAKISFWLQKGNYATTILRELCKTE